MLAAESSQTGGASDIRSIDDIETEVRERITELSISMHMENQTLVHQQEDLLRRATTDPLTGVGNRGAFDARLSLELERSARNGTLLALLLIDVDHFKRVNDNYGYQAGDRGLQIIAGLLDQNVRKVDFVARYGGEEFAVIAPSSSEEGSLLLAERLMEAMEGTPISWQGETIRITISVGIEVLREATDAKEAAVAVIRAADEQLYAAKCAGRNRVSPGKPQRIPAGAGRDS